MSISYPRQRLLITFDHLQHQFYYDVITTTRRPALIIRNRILLFTARRRSKQDNLSQQTPTTLMKMACLFRSSEDILNFFCQWFDYLNNSTSNVSTTTNTNTSFSFGDITWLQQKLHEIIYACFYGSYQETIILEFMSVLEKGVIPLDGEVFFIFYLSNYYGKYNVMVLTELLTSLAMIICLCNGLLSNRNEQASLFRLLDLLDNNLLMMRDNILYSLLYAFKRFPSFIQAFASYIRLLQERVSVNQEGHVLMNVNHYCTLLMEMMQLHSVNKALINETIMPCIQHLIQIALTHSYRLHHNSGRELQDLNCCCELVTIVHNIVTKQGDQPERFKHYCEIVNALSRDKAVSNEGINGNGSLRVCIFIRYFIPTLITMLVSYQNRLSTPTEKILIEIISRTLWKILVDLTIMEGSTFTGLSELISNPSSLSAIWTCIGTLLPALTIHAVNDLDHSIVTLLMLYYFAFASAEQVNTEVFKGLLSMFLTRTLSLNNVECDLIVHYQSVDSGTKSNVCIHTLIELLHSHQDRLGTSLTKKCFLCLFARCQALQQSDNLEFISHYPKLLKVLIEGIRQYYSDDALLVPCCNSIIMVLPRYALHSESFKNGSSTLHSQDSIELCQVSVGMLHQLVQESQSIERLAIIAKVLLAICQTSVSSSLSSSCFFPHLMNTTNLATTLVRAIVYCSQSNEFSVMNHQHRNIAHNVGKSLLNVLWYSLKSLVFYTTVTKNFLPQLCLILRSWLSQSLTTSTNDTIKWKEWLFLLLAVFDQTGIVTSTTTDQGNFTTTFRQLCVYYQLNPSISSSKSQTTSYTALLVKLLESCVASPSTVEFMTHIVQALCYRSRLMTVLESSSSALVVNQFQATQDRLQPLLLNDLLIKHKLSKSIMIPTCELIDNVVMTIPAISSMSTIEPDEASLPILLSQACWYNVIHCLTLYSKDSMAVMSICSMLPKVIQQHAIVREHFLSMESIFDLLVLKFIVNHYSYSKEFSHTVILLLLALTDSASNKNENQEAFKEAMHRLLSISNAGQLINELLVNHLSSLSASSSSTIALQFPLDLMRLIRRCVTYCLTDTNDCTPMMVNEWLPANRTLIQLNQGFASDKNIFYNVCFFANQSLAINKHSSSDWDRVVKGCIVALMNRLQQESNKVIVSAKGVFTASSTTAVDEILVKECLMILIQWLTTVNTKRFWITALFSASASTQYLACIQQLRDHFTIQSSSMFIIKCCNRILSAVIMYNLWSLQELIVSKYTSSTEETEMQHNLDPLSHNEKLTTEIETATIFSIEEVMAEQSKLQKMIRYALNSPEETSSVSASHPGIFSDDKQACSLFVSLLSREENDPLILNGIGNMLYELCNRSEYYHKIFKAHKVIIETVCCHLKDDGQGCKGMRDLLLLYKKDEVLTSSVVTMTEASSVSDDIVLHPVKVLFEDIN